MSKILSKNYNVSFQVVDILMAPLTRHLAEVSGAPEILLWPYTFAHVKRLVRNYNKVMKLRFLDMTILLLVWLSRMVIHICVSVQAETMHKLQTVTV